MGDKRKLLIIDDEVAIRRFMRASLDHQEYELLEAETGAEGLRLAATRNPEVILLDLGLPDLDGVEVAKQIREWSQVPIIVLSARGQEQDKVNALDAGADDYLTKPFGMNELLARIRASIRRAKPEEADEPLIQAGNLQIDFAARRVTRDGVEIRLTPNEYKLLAMLAHHPDRVMTHKQLLLEVWGPAYEEESHYLRVYMGQLRHKLEADPARPTLLRTEPGVGYRFTPNPS